MSDLILGLLVGYLAGCGSLVLTLFVARLPARGSSLQAVTANGIPAP